MKLYLLALEYTYQFSSLVSLVPMNVLSYIFFEGTAIIYFIPYLVLCMSQIQYPAILGQITMHIVQGDFSKVFHGFSCTPLCSVHAFIFGKYLHYIECLSNC